MENIDWSTEGMFYRLAGELTKLQPEVVDQFLCPLCMKLFDATDLASGKVSVDHIVPGALRGDALILTCTSCNNTHGSLFDSQIVRAMNALDGVAGIAPIRGTLQNDEGHVSVEITFRSLVSDEPNDIRIIGEASHPKGVKAIRPQLYDGAVVNFKLHFGFAKDRYWSAVLRIAYLANFQRLGYPYILSAGAEQVRRVLDEISPMPGIVLQAYLNAELSSPLLILPLHGARASFYMVIIRVESAAKRHIAVLLPWNKGCDWKTLADIASNPGQLRATTTPEDSGEMSIRFEEDPIKAIERSPFQNADQGSG